MISRPIPPEYVGWWHLVESEMWDSEALDLLGPALLSIGSPHGDRLRMIAIIAHVQCQFVRNAVSFSFEGFSEYDPISGAGRVKLGKDGRLSGKLQIRDGDETTFMAERTQEPSTPIEFRFGGRRSKWGRR